MIEDCIANLHLSAASGMMSIAENIARVRERIAAAAARVRRDPHSVTLMAVSKTVDRERIRQASEAGVRVFGENRVQEFEEKFPHLVTESWSITISTEAC